MPSPLLRLPSRTRLLLIPIMAACGGERSTAPAFGAPAQVLVISGDGQTGPAGLPLANPIVAKVVDDRGRAVRGRGLTVAVTSGGGTYAGEHRTDDFGLVTGRWTLGPSTAGPQRLQFSTSGREGTFFVDFTATVSAGSATTGRPRR